MKTILFILLAVIHISHPETWTRDSLKTYVGKDVTFDCPMYITYNGGWSGSVEYRVSPRRIYSPTNQELPGTEQYQRLVTLNNNGTIIINNLPSGDKIHRMGQRIHNLTAHVNSINSLSYQSGSIQDNSRSDMEAYARDRFTQLGDYNLLVCAMNCEYYLPNTFGTGYGPDDADAHQRQIEKVVGALAAIDADIYGLIEVQQGITSVAEIAAELQKRTSHHATYGYQNTTNTAGSGSYTGAGILWRTDILEKVGAPIYNNIGTGERKQMQAFRHKATGDIFIYSINHFKAKSGTPNSTADYDHGDGQGIFNSTRVTEARSVVSKAKTLSIQLRGENDVLVMGDLNAYAKEDPIRVFTDDNGYIDLHRAFHADSSYSYTYQGTAGYLDHAIASPALFPKVTGMMGYHINSDENDCYTYDGARADRTIFRCSDHDPILVGLKLSELNNEVVISNDTIRYFRLYDPYGHMISQGKGTSTINKGPIAPGLYILVTYLTDDKNNHKMESRTILVE